MKKLDELLIFVIFVVIVAGIFAAINTNTNPISEGYKGQRYKCSVDRLHNISVYTDYKLLVCQTDINELYAKEPFFKPVVKDNLTSPSLLYVLKKGMNEARYSNLSRGWW